MNRIIKSVAIGISLGLAVLWCVPQDANAKTVTVYRRIAVASGQVWGGVGTSGAKGDNQSSLVLSSTPFAVPLGARRAALFAHLPDTLYGGATVSDTIHVSLATKPEGLVDSAITDWVILPSTGGAGTQLGRCQLVGVATKPLGSSMTRFYDADSTTASAINGTFYNAGVMKFILWGPTNDTVADAAINVDCYLIYDDGK